MTIDATTRVEVIDGALKALNYFSRGLGPLEPAKAMELASALPIRACTFTHAEFRNSFQSQLAPWGNDRIGDELPYVPCQQF